MHFAPPSIPTEKNRIKIISNMNHQQGSPAMLPCLDSISHILNPDRGNFLKSKQGVYKRLTRHEFFEQSDIKHINKSDFYD